MRTVLRRPDFRLLFAVMGVGMAAAAGYLWAGRALSAPAAGVESGSATRLAAETAASGPAGSWPARAEAGSPTEPTETAAFPG